MTLYQALTTILGGFLLPFAYPSHLGEVGGSIGTTWWLVGSCPHHWAHLVS